MSRFALDCAVAAAFLALGLARSDADEHQQNSDPQKLKAELQQFRPEFYPQKVQARLELKIRAFAHLPPSDPGKGFHPQRFVIQLGKLWPPGSEVRVAFKETSQDLNASYQKIEAAASEWTKPNRANLKFSFKDAAGNYRKYKPSDTAYAAEIRVSFDHPEGGFWSVIGTDSVDKNVLGPGEPSLNLEGFDTPAVIDAATATHEFGHAIGFLHEHQSPLSGCDAEFKWYDDDKGPGLYTLLAQQGWSKATVDFNLRQLPSSSAFLLGPYDRQSIMHYHFPAQFFVKGEASPCYVPRNLVLSAGDIQGAKNAYPAAQADINALETEKKLHRDELNKSKMLNPKVLKSFDKYEAK